tara:strand:- start:2121 stop:3131 length:1011 start_codon:yes stop_codon:yes gene_type:complete
MANKKQVKFGFGYTLINLGLDFSVENAKKYLGIVEELGLIEEGRPRPFVEVLLYHNPDEGLDLMDPNRSYLDKFKGMRKLFEKYGVDSKVLLFHGEGSGIDIGSPLGSQEHVMGYTTACSGLIVAQFLGSKDITGPWDAEQKKRRGFHQDAWDEGIKVVNATAQELEVYANIENLRKEEKRRNVIEPLLDDIDRLKLTHIKVQGDLCHFYANDGQDLVSTINMVKPYMRVLHVTEYGPWGSKINRGVLSSRPTAEVNPVSHQLPGVMEELKDWKGVLSLETPHPVFYGAVGRSDPVVWNQPVDEHKYEFAKQETVQGFQRMRQCRGIVESDMNKKK